MNTPQDVLAFWLDELSPKDWYSGSDALDAKVRERFEPLLAQAQSGQLGMWLTNPSETLAYIILTDQMSRNIYRDEGQAFYTDHMARAAAKIAIDRKWDLKIDEPARQFFYLPLMHSENQIDQDRAVRLFMMRMPQTGALHIEHACAHREVIRRFGRFPFRNVALGRPSTPAEVDFMDAGGYGTVIREMQQKKVA